MISSQNEDAAARIEVEIPITFVIYQMTARAGDEILVKSKSASLMYDPRIYIFCIKVEIFFTARLDNRNDIKRHYRSPVLDGLKLSADVYQTNRTESRAFNLDANAYYFHNLVTGAPCLIVVTISNR